MAAGPAVDPGQVAAPGEEDRGLVEDPVAEAEVVVLDSAVELDVLLGVEIQAVRGFEGE